jgi:hypothetical protein
MLCQYRVRSAITVFLLLFVTAVEGQSAGLQPGVVCDTDGWIPYEATDFRVCLPPGWRDGASLLDDMPFMERTAVSLGMNVDEYTEAFRLFVVDRDFYALDESGVWVEIWQTPSATAPLDEQYGQVRALQNGKIQILSQEHFSLPAGETERVWLRYTERQRFREVVTDILDVAILTPDHIYHLTFYADPTVYEDYEAIFDGVISSFALLPDPQSLFSDP